MCAPKTDKIRPVETLGDAGSSCLCGEHSSSS